MAASKIDELVWRALTEPDFRKGLLNGRRQELVEGFGLSDEEEQLVLGIQATTLESFAMAICRSPVYGA